MFQERSVRYVSGLYTAASGGGGGIRTPGTLSGTTVFKTAGFNRSPTPPFLILAYSANQRHLCPSPALQLLHCGARRGADAPTIQEGRVGLKFASNRTQAGVTGDHAGSSCSISGLREMN